MDPLDELAGWPVDRAAAAVVGADRLLATYGPGADRFRLASITKLFTALATLVAMEEGTVPLDAPAGPPGATVRHLLAHASGLGFEATAGPLAPPGTRRIYSNAGYQALGAELAARTTVAAPTYVTEAVLEPLGMHATSIENGDLAAGAFGTVDDLVRFAGELLSPTLVTEATFAMATAVTFPGLAGVLPGFGRQDPCDWGLGFELRGGKHPHWTGATNSPGTFGHFGGAGTFVWVDPAVRRALVVLTDREFGEWALDRWPRLSDAVLAERAP